MLPFNFGPVELILILIIVAMLFGVGKLPEVFGSVGKGIREFQRALRDTRDEIERPDAPRSAAPPRDAAPKRLVE